MINFLRGTQKASMQINTQASFQNNLDSAVDEDIADIVSASYGKPLNTRVRVVNDHNLHLGVVKFTGID